MELGRRNQSLNRTKPIQRDHDLPVQRSQLECHVVFKTVVRESIILYVNAGHDGCQNVSRTLFFIIELKFERQYVPRMLPL